MISLLSDARDVLLEPRAFFTRKADELAAPGSLWRPLMVGLVFRSFASAVHIAWLRHFVASVSDVWDGVVRIVLEVIFKNPDIITHAYVKTAQGVFNAFLSVGVLLISIGVSAVRITLFALLIQMGLKFFTKGSATELTAESALTTESATRLCRYETTLKVVAFAQVPWILAVFPVFGTLLGFILALLATVQGLVAVYGFPYKQVACAVTFPFVLLVGFFLLVCFLVVFLAYSMLQLLF